MTKLTRYQPAAPGFPWPCASNGFFKTFNADSSAPTAASDGSNPARYFTPNWHRSMEPRSCKRVINIVTSSAVCARDAPAKQKTASHAVSDRLDMTFLFMGSLLLRLDEFFRCRAHGVRHGAEQVAPLLVADFRGLADDVAPGQRISHLALQCVQLVPLQGWKPVTDGEEFAEERRAVRRVAPRNPHPQMPQG